MCQRTVECKFMRTKCMECFASGADENRLRLECSEKYGIVKCFATKRRAHRAEKQ